MTGSKKKSLGVCLIVRDEETNLPNILSDIKSFSDEIIVVDTGSLDRSIEIAQDAGAFVIEKEWQGDFSKARNVSIENSKADWIIWVDADDRIAPDQGEKIIKLVREAPDNICYRVKVLNVDPNGSHSPFMQLRLFPNDPKIRFSNIIHESVTLSAETAGFFFEDTSITIQHFGYSTPQLIKKKLQRNLEFLKEELLREPFNVSIRFNYANTLRELEEFEASLKEFQIIMDNERAVKSQPDIFGQSFTEAARTHYRLGHLHEAIRTIEKAIQVNPEDINTMALAGDILLKSGDENRAEMLFYRALLLDQKISSIPMNYSTIRLYCNQTLCNLLIRKGDFSAVERILKGETRMFPDQHENWLLLGDFYVGMNRVEEGLEVYQKILDRFPDLENVKQRLLNHKK